MSIVLCIARIILTLFTFVAGAGVYWRRMQCRNGIELCWAAQHSASTTFHCKLLLKQIIK